jgi:archaetidylinositol phosphate synthase
MIGNSWTHLLARVVVSPFLGTRLRPNHLTTLRLLSGLAACVCFALGTKPGMGWGGGLWLLSAFLDRADGELARIGNMMSRGGHLYDYYTDCLVNSLFFAAVGLGLRHSWLGHWAILFGIISAAALMAASIFSEQLEQRNPLQTRAYSGRWGFDPDDALYLMAPFAWLNWLSPILVAATVGTTVMMVITWLRLRRMVAAAEPTVGAGSIR